MIILALFAISAVILAVYTYFENERLEKKLELQTKRANDRYIFLLGKLGAQEAETEILKLKNDHTDFKLELLKD